MSCDVKAKLNYIDDSQVIECKKSNLKLEIRFLNKDDIDEVKLLFQDSFPINYPHSWYVDITTSQRFMSIAAVYEYTIIGILVAELKTWSTLSKDDKMILMGNAIKPTKSTAVAYILSLGVHRKFRRNGIASLLLESFLSDMNSNECYANVKICYLHVLSTNQPAILFYEKHNFFCHSFLPFYYSINGQAKDAFVMISYINNSINQHKRSSLLVYSNLKEFCTRIFLKSFNFVGWIAGKCRMVIDWINYNTLSKLHFTR